MFIYGILKLRRHLDTETYGRLPLQFFSISQVKLQINGVILLHEKFLQFDWLRAVVFQLNLKYLHVKITNLLRVVV